jgi:hypothetical protein
MVTNYKTNQINYPVLVDTKIIRTIAFITMTISIIFLFSVYQWLIIPLFIDFLLRWFNPKYSPLAFICKIFHKNILNTKPEMVYSAPKRFAVLIGIILTGLMTIAFLLGFQILFIVLAVSLLIASSLQAIFDYCLGCEIYNVLVNANILRREENINQFLK